MNLQWRALKFDAVVNLLSAVVVQTGARGQAPVERKIETTQKTRLADSAAGRLQIANTPFSKLLPQQSADHTAMCQHQVG